MATRGRDGPARARDHSPLLGRFCRTRHAGRESGQEALSHASHPTRQAAALTSAPAEPALRAQAALDSKPRVRGRGGVSGGGARSERRGAGRDGAEPAQQRVGEEGAVERKTEHRDNFSLFSRFQNCMGEKFVCSVMCLLAKSAASDWPRPPFNIGFRLQMEFCCVEIFFLLWSLRG